MSTCTTRPVTLNRQWCFMIWSDLSLSCQQALVCRAEDVIHTLSKSVQLSVVREPWVDDLHRLKENLRSSVQHLYQTLRKVSDFHYTLNRVCASHLLTKSLQYWWCCIMAFDLVYVCQCKDWYKQVLCETFLSDLSQRREGLCESSFSPDGLVWRRGVETFLTTSPCPDVHELVKLTHLSNVITDPCLQHTGKRLSHR